MKSKINYSLEEWANLSDEEMFAAWDKQSAGYEVACDAMRHAREIKVFNVGDALIIEGRYNQAVCKVRVPAELLDMDDVDAAERETRPTKNARPIKWFGLF